MDSRLLLVVVMFQGALSGCAGTLPRKLTTDDIRVRNFEGNQSRCQVMATHSEPLVTEWSASSKARLEALLNETLADTDRNAIGVQYTGCELRIVDDCRPNAAYDWSKTTLARDTIEINDADELYAKLPLGAATLEGALKRSGRLSVQTIVAGQIKIKRASIDLNGASKDPSCAEATHLIASVSIGAFKMLAGGRGQVSGGAGISGIGSARASSSSEESLVREAGDAHGCNETDEKTPNRNCRSPIQLFLLPIPNRTARATQPPTGIASPPSDKAPKSAIMRTLSYIFGGVGLASLGGGTGSYMVSNGIESKLKDGGYATPQDQTDALGALGNTRTLGVTGLISGGLLLGVAVPLYLMGGK